MTSDIDCERGSRYAMSQELGNMGRDRILGFGENEDSMRFLMGEEDIGEDYKPREKSRR